MEIEEEDLKKLLRTTLSAIYTMDEAVELFDKKSPATAMSFLGAETEKITQNLYELEKSNHQIREMLEKMQNTTSEDEQKLDKVIKGEADIDELF